MAIKYPRYTDPEAVAAMAAKANNNPLNHDRYTNDEATAAATDADWLRPPIADFYDPTGGLPAGPAVGDRYISEATANGWTEDYVYEWDGDSWVEDVPEEGWTIWNLLELIYYVFFSGGWMPLPSIHHATHENGGTDEISVAGLSGVLADDQHIIDAEAVTAMGALGNGNPLNHTRYADAESVTAMGALGNANPLNHTRYGDAEAIASLTNMGGGNIGNVGTLGVGIATPNAASIVDFTSITKGMLPPRMTTVQRDAIASPVEGLFIYNTDTDTLNWYSGSAWEGAIPAAYGEFKIAENAVATVIRGTSEWQALTANVATGLQNLFSYEAGAVGTVASVADVDGSIVTITTGAAHNLAVDDITTINGTTDYNGIFKVLSVPAGNTFTINETYTNTQVGHWQQGATLTVLAGGAGVYKGTWAATGISAVNAKVFDFSPVVNVTVATAATARRKFSNADYGSFSGTELVTLAVGDKVTFVVRNITSTDDITIRGFDLNLHRLQ